MQNITDISNLYNTYTSLAQNKVPAKSTKAENTDSVTATAKGTDKYNTAKLSDKAQALFDSLKEKYKDYDLYVADYKNDDEANEVLSQSTKDFAVVFTSGELEKMAADDSYRDKIEKFINDSHDTLQSAVEKLKSGQNDDADSEGKGVKSDDIERLGISLNENGEVSYFADLLKSSENQTKKINDEAAKAREKKAEEEKKADKKEKAEAADKTADKVSDKKTEKRATVKADTIDDLIKKLQEFDWSKVKETPIGDAGRYIDYTV